MWNNNRRSHPKKERKITISVMGYIKFGFDIPKFRFSLTLFVLVIEKLINLKQNWSENNVR